jgi:hypothetical protein
MDVEVCQAKAPGELLIAELNSPRHATASRRLLFALIDAFSDLSSGP